MNDKLTHVVIIVLLAVVSTLIYFESSKHSYVADDGALIYWNADFLKDWSNVKTTFVSPLPVKTYEPLPFYRPVTSLTYFLSNHLFKSIRNDHLFNLGIHILNVALLYLLIFLLFKNVLLSFFTGLFFAAHPVHLSSVVWISGRTDLIACFFFLLTMILFVKMKEHEKSPQKLLLVGASVTYVLCLFSKETTLALPLLLFAWDYFSKKEPIKKKIMPYIPLAAITILYLVWRVKVIGNLGTGDAYTSSGLFHRILTIFPIYFYYFKKLVFPLQFNYSPQVLPGSFILSLKFVVSLIFIVIVLWLGMSIRKRSKEVWLGILWIFISLLPVLNLVPLYAPAKEWWAYIPSIGFCLILGKLAVEGIRWEKRIVEITLFKKREEEETVKVENEVEKKKFLGIKMPALPQKILIKANHLVTLFFALLLIFYALNVGSQTKVFRKDLFFWRAAVKQAPHDAVAHNAYGEELRRRGAKRMAEAEFKSAVRAKPDFAMARNNLGALYYQRAQNDFALVEIQEAIKLDSSFVDAYTNLGLVYAAKKEFVASIEAFNEALKLDPDYYPAVRNLGMVYSYIGDFSLAIEYLEKAVQLTRNPRDIEDIEKIIENFKARQE